MKSQSEMCFKLAAKGMSRFSRGEERKNKPDRERESVDEETTVE